MASRAQRRRAASTSTGQSRAPRRPGGQSRCRTHRRHSTEARRAPGASRSSLLASSPPVAKAKGADAKRSADRPSNRATSSRNAERDQIGMPGEIIPEQRATSVGIRTEPLTDGELTLFKSVAGHRAPPTRQVKELVVIVGRRGGKDSIA